MREIHIAVIQTPKISNFTDFDALSREPDVNVRFVQKGDLIGDPDLIILPGSKIRQRICCICTAADMPARSGKWRERGFL